MSLSRRQRRRGDPNVRVRRRDLGPIIANQYGPAVMQTVVYVSNKEGTRLRVLEGIRGCSIDMSNFRETTWNLSLVVDRDQDFDPLSDWARVDFQVLMPDGDLKSYPRGVYKFDRTSASHTRGGDSWSLEGYSAELLLMQDGPEQAYKVESGTMVLRKVLDIITDRGIDERRIKLPLSEDKALKTPRMFDPGQNEDQMSWFGICNGLLGSAAFAALWVDSDNRWYTDKLKDINDQQPAVYYGPGLEEEPIILDGADEVQDDERFANKVIVTSEDPNEKNPVFATAKNTDPNSEGSRLNYGRWKIKRVAKPNVVDKESAQRIANSQLRTSSAFKQTLSYRTPPDPERGVREYHHIRIPQKRGPELIGTFRNVGFSQDCYPSPKEMSFESSRTERV